MNAPSSIWQHLRGGDEFGIVLPAAAAGLLASTD
jgi:hypothetical protein